MNSNNDSLAPLDSELLRTFLAVAKYNNVTRAAAAVFRTQSAVSVQIKKLEQRLGSQLMIRKARGIILTEAGEKLRQHAERIVRDLDQTALAFSSEPLGGIVGIGIPDDYGLDVLPGILREFALQHAAVEVFVRCEFSTRFPEAIDRGELDIAVCASQLISEDADDLFEEETVWACAKNFIVDPDQPVPLAMFGRSCWWRDSAIQALENSAIRYRLAYSSESLSGVKAAISAGLAVGLLARSSVDSSLTVLDSKSGFPPLPKTRLQILEKRKTQTEVARAMSKAIRLGFAQYNH